MVNGFLHYRARLLARYAQPKFYFPALLTLMLILQLCLFRQVDSAPDTAQVLLQTTRYAQSPYRALLSKYDSKLRAMSHSEKCTAYFQELYQSDSNWKNTDFKDHPYHRNIFNKKNEFIDNRLRAYKDNELKDIKDDAEKNRIMEGMDLYDLYEKQWQDACNATRATEQRLVDAMGVLRVYGSCYLGQNGETSKGAGRECLDVEARAFNWLTKYLPTYTRWDGTVTRDLPVMSEYVDQDREKRPEQNPCYLGSLRDSLNGKGLVVSAADNHVEGLIKLIGSLRALGSTLPLQIVHSGDLSEKTRNRLTGVARELNSSAYDLIDNLDSAVIHRGIVLPDPKRQPDLFDERLQQLIPPLELWFVDTSDVISPQFRHRFKGYGNKLIAFMFASFRHTILIDIDTAFTADPKKYILESPFYQVKGAYFFRDRELPATNSHSDLDFYKSLMPSNVDETLFGIPAITDFTLENRFINGRRKHYMESGVVAIDRRRHFTGLLTIMQILLWEQVTDKVWGDKELFWLGMSMSGDEDYYMNAWPAGAAGHVTPRNRRLLDDKTDTRRNALKSKEICSTHPAHLSPVDNTTLLWFNSGFGVCKNPHSAEKDHSHSGYMKGLKKSAIELKNFYESYERIEAIVVPYAAEYHVPNDRGESDRGWKMSDACKGFIWCAYDLVGGKDVPGKNGYVHHFSREQRQLYDFYGSIWERADSLFVNPK